MNNENTTPAKIKKDIRRTKIGIYTVAITAILLAVLVVANVIVYSLPSKYTIFDTTATSWTEISEDSAAFIKTVNIPVKIYILCEDGDIDIQYEKLLNNYSDTNDNIKIEIVDPLKNPNFTSHYTDSELENYSVIVESDKRFKVINSTDMIYYMDDYINKIMGSELKLTYEAVYQYSQYYGAYMNPQQYFQAETLITSALDYVTIENIPYAYILETTGESEMSELLLTMFEGSNIQTKSLNLKTAESVPDDATCIVIYDPADDISNDEYTRLETYIRAGGSVLMMTNLEASSQPNLMKLASLFGLSAEEGMIRDPDSNHNNGGKTNILMPDIANHAISLSLLSAGYTVQIPNAHSIVISDELPEGVKASKLFYTTKSACRVSIAADSTQEVEIGEAGVHNVGVISTITINNDLNANMVWISSAEAFTDTYANASSGGNYYYLSSALRWMSDTFSSEYASIPGTNVSAEVLDRLTFEPVIVWGIIIVCVIPLALLVPGFVVWFRRRRR